MKFCKDCIHYSIPEWVMQVPTYHRSFAECNERIQMNIVDGSIERVTCQLARQDDHRCGPHAAKFVAAKPI
jgi:hypothetical protein